MVKKLLTLALALIVASGLMAQPAPKTVTINQSDIQFWTGTGTNSTVVAIGWDDSDASYTPTVVVWGIHWNGNITLLNALDTIAAYDSRFSYTISGSYITGLTYSDPSAGVNLTPSAGWNCNNYNGVYNLTNLSSTWLRISESTCDNYNFTGVNNLIYASDPNAGSGTLPDTVDASLPFSDILYWVGTGTDSAEFIVSYGLPDTAFAWGYLFNTGTTIQQMINDIAAADPRLTIVGDPSYSGDILFVLDNGDTLGLSPVIPAVGYNFWWTNLNGMSVASLTTTLTGGDVFKYGDYNSATGWDFQYGFFMQEAWNTIPTPVPAPADPAPVEATIDFNDIIYWVGTGSNEAVLVVNWADTALAWGYRWNDSATVADMMSDIADDDPRFSYTGTGWIDDITFNDSIVSLAGTPGNYWGSTNNGIMDMGMGQVLNNGDLEKWGDPAAGVIVDSNNYGGPVWYYTYAYPMTIHPVSIPDSTGHGTEPEHGPFCGAVGTEGCDAIAADSNIIVAWATACSVVNGPVDITNPNGPVVIFGNVNMAVGPATTSTTDAVSLGDGGSATVTFALPIANGDGPDFAVFENSFNDYFLELGFVEVSSDGVHFVRFPATSLTPTDVQVVSYVDPTYINNLAGKYRVGFGTPFDLEELRDSAGINLNNITHVRIVDVVGTIDPQYATYDAFGHIVNDPWPTNDTIWGSGGFDLTGVAVIHQNPNAIETASEESINVYPNPTAKVLNINAKTATTAELYDFSGRLVASPVLHTGVNTVDLGQLPAGIYMLRVDGMTSKVVKM